jgi:hypothetical protein
MTSGAKRRPEALLFCLGEPNPYSFLSVFDKDDWLSLRQEMRCLARTGSLIYSCRRQLCFRQLAAENLSVAVF